MPSIKPNHLTDKDNKFIRIRQQKQAAAYSQNPNLELSQSFYNFAAKFFRFGTFI